MTKSKKLVQINFHGELANKFHAKWNLAVNSVSEGLYAIDVVNNYKLTTYLLEKEKEGIKYKILVNGKKIIVNQDNSAPEKLINSIKNSELHIINNKIKTIDIIPIIEGSDSDFLSALTIVVGIVLIAVSPFAGPLGPALAIGGLALIGAGVINLLSSPPKFSDFREIGGNKGRVSYLFSGPENVTREGGPVPQGYGRLFVGSQVISAAYNVYNVDARGLDNVSPGSIDSRFIFNADQVSSTDDYAMNIYPYDTQNSDDSGRVFRVGKFNSPAGDTSRSIFKCDDEGKKELDDEFAEFILNNTSAKITALDFDSRLSPDPQIDQRRLYVVGDIPFSSSLINTSIKLDMGGARHPFKNIFAIKIRKDVSLGNGNLDDSFIVEKDSVGIITPQNPNPTISSNKLINGIIHCIAVQTDGGVIIGGDFTRINGITRGRLARLKYNGDIDTTFPNFNINDTVRCIKIQRDGNILIGGDFTSVGGSTKYKIARLNNNINQNGDVSVDTSFTLTSAGTPGNPWQSGGMGNKGIYTIGCQYSANVLQNIIIGGDFLEDGSMNQADLDDTQYNGRVAKLSPAGVMDKTYYPVMPNGSIVRTLYVQELDNKVIIGGSFSQVDNVARDNVNIARLNSTTVDRKTLDDSFNFGPDGGLDGQVYFIKVFEHTGKIYVAGKFNLISIEGKNNDISRNQVIRLHNGDYKN